MDSTISPLLGRYKLDARFVGTTVTHLTYKSDFATQQRVAVQTVWKTEGRLGAGAFGEVWRQRSKSGQFRAVKIISKAQVNVQEIETLISLHDHPDLFILFFGWFEDLERDTIHLAMEFIEHGDLGRYMEKYQSMVDAKEITSQILRGLVVLHERKICHRDLKPQNILVACLSPIWVKITDFGISKRWQGTSLKTHCGTTLYRSPEQLGLLPRGLKISTKSYTNSIDLWALGAIVHEMLTQEIPFLDTYVDSDPDIATMTSTQYRAVDMDVLYGYCRGLIPFPCGSLQKYGVSEEVIEFVKSLMVVNPSERASAALAVKSPWLVRIDSPGSPLPLSAGLPRPSPATESHDRKERGERAGQSGGVLVIDPFQSPTSGQISARQGSGYDQEANSTLTDNAPLPPADEAVPDQTRDTIDITDSGDLKTINSTPPTTISVKEKHISRNPPAPTMAEGNDVVNGRIRTDLQLRPPPPRADMILSEQSTEGSSRSAHVNQAPRTAPVKRPATAEQMQILTTQVRTLNAQARTQNARLSRGIRVANKKLKDNET